MELLVDRDGELGRKSTALSTPSILATDKHPATYFFKSSDSCHVLLLMISQGE